MTEKRYKCDICKITIVESDLEDCLACPNCHSSMAVKEMCPNDTIECTHDILDGLAYCPICGEPCCPECKSHDVAQISRITGYLQEVGGWNAGKQQELKDRHRVNIPEGA